MKYFGAGLSESHKELNRIIRKPELIEQTKELFLEIHGKLPSLWCPVMRETRPMS